MAKKNASSSGDTSAVHPYKTRSFWIARYYMFKEQNKPESVLKRVEAIINEFKDIPNYLPNK